MTKRSGQSGNLEGVRLALVKSERLEPPAPPQDEAPIDPKDGDGDGILPADCPVIPLGIDGKTRFYLDPLGQMVAMSFTDHSRLGIASLFGGQDDYLMQHWPRWSQDPNNKGQLIRTGWKPEEVALNLMAACNARKTWRPDESLRGPGARRGDNGELILNLGDRVQIYPCEAGAFDKVTTISPGVHGDWVYPAGKRLAAPAVEPAPGGTDKGPGAHVLRQLKTWNFRRPIDAILALGWIGAAMTGGAQKWRPVIWVTGGRNCGKSTFQEMIRLLLPGIIGGADLSPANVYQRLDNTTVPVALDESEAEEDNRKLQAMIKLARLVGSGEQMGRGGQDGQAKNYTLRSAFMFSSIYVPPLLAQDRSRMAILELGALVATAKQPDFKRAEWQELGRQLLRRMVDGWHRLDETLGFYRAALAEGGHSGRGQDQFGTLLACADLLLFDESPTSDSAAEWVDQLHAEDLAETASGDEDTDRFLQVLLTMPVDPYRSGLRQTLSWWIRRAAGLEPGQEDDEKKRAAEALYTFGLAVKRHQGQKYLAIADSSQGLAALLRDTHWKGGAGGNGVWVQAAQRIPGAIRPKGAADATGRQRDKVIYFGSFSTRATLIPMALVCEARPVPKATVPGMEPDDD